MFRSKFSPEQEEWMLCAQSANTSINSRVRTQSSEVDNQLAKHCTVFIKLVVQGLKEL